MRSGTTSHSALVDATSKSVVMTIVTSQTDGPHGQVGFRSQRRVSIVT